MEKKNSQKQIEQDVDYAYAVLNAFKEAVAKVNPENEMQVKQLTYETAAKLPAIFEAIVALVKEEHREQMVEVMKAWSTLLKYQQKKI